MEIAQSVVIVTGASSGIGMAAARHLAQRGARVALVARSQDILDQLAEELPGSLAVVADMRDLNAIAAMVTKVHQHYGRIDVLVNNAGQGMPGTIADANIEHFRSIFEVNVVGVLAAMQAVIPIMRQQQGGVIINISSGLAKMIVPHVGPYASTKYMLNALSLTARMELAPENIRVGLVLPGITATNFFRNSAGSTAAHAADATPQRGNMPIDTPDMVAEKIIQAIETEAAETYADSILDRINR